MCGIVAALPVYADADPLSTSDMVDLLGAPAALAAALEVYATPGAVMTLAGPAAEPVRAALDRLAESVDPDLREVGDQLWALRHDRVEAAVRAHRLAAGGWTTRSVTSYAAVNSVLDALDRLEVRGRDSAGLTVWIELDAADRTRLAGRGDPRFRGGSVSLTGHGACFAYKRAAILGRLGDNTRHLRQAIRADADLHRALALPSAAVTVLAHTRWASVGRTSEDNAHPVDSQGSTMDGPYAIAALNGDVDNHAALRERCGYHATDVTTDAKVIPLLLSRELAGGATPPAAMRATLAGCTGSMAIAAQCDGAEPGELLLAVKGSGQSLYVGLAPGGHLVASETYGLVGVTSRYARVDGQQWPGGTVMRLTRAGGLDRWDGAGEPRPLRAEEIRRAEVSTRDLALGEFEHHLQKEIHEAAGAFRKTLRGRVHTDGNRPFVSLPDSSVPAELRRRLRAGEIRQLVVVGQGTAAVAGQGIAQLIRSLVGDGALPASACPATEFSAWRLRPDMSDTCVVAVSQSGSTTDTNRAVDLARARGATVLSIVNRRDSDLAAKSDGVLYTSDGRDVELSVASTKAFYAQVAAGCLLGAELAAALGRSVPDATSLLRGLLRLPGQLADLHGLSESIAKVAGEVAAAHPYWAVVGSGPNRVAAAEIRIKLSELCYRTVSADAVEDKKHIDLSAEALVLVCAAGAPPHQVGDLVKEVEILNAHRNRVVVVCDEGTEYLWPAEFLVPVPRVHPELAWIMATAAGHLFAYHAARAIDATADDVRAALAGLEAAVDRGEPVASGLPVEVLGLVRRTLAAAARGELRGVLSSQAAVGLARIAYAPEPDGPDDVRAALTAALDELARPVDTVRHQAKTVTVGTSRGDADLYDNEIVAALCAAGTDLADLTFPVLDVIRAHARVVGRARGVTRYRRTGDRLAVIGKTGVARELPSRADRGAPLRGSKRRVAEIRVPRLLRGRLDGRIVLIVPEQVSGEVSALAVVHVEVRDRCQLADLRAAMDSVGDRMAEIAAAVSETRPGFTPEQLLTLPAATILLDPVEMVAGKLG